MSSTHVGKIVIIFNFKRKKFLQGNKKITKARIENGQKTKRVRNKHKWPIST